MEQDEREEKAFSDFLSVDSEKEVMDLLRGNMWNQFAITHGDAVSLFDRSGIMLALSTVIFMETLAYGSDPVWIAAMMTTTGSMVAGLLVLVINVKSKYGFNTARAIEYYLSHEYDSMSTSMDNGLLNTYTTLQDDIKKVTWMFILQFGMLAISFACLLTMRVI